jgi:hypothetical protein
MKKLTAILVLVGIFAIGAFVGLSTAPAQAGMCYWMCGCNGVPYKCCITPSGPVCKPDPNGPINCPQGENC